MLKQRIKTFIEHVHSVKAYNDQDKFLPINLSC